jgi:hypothetical protein
VWVGGDPPTHPPSGDVQGLLDTSSKLIAEASHGTEAERKHKVSHSSRPPCPEA